MTDKSLILGQAIGMALSLGVGILIGARACTVEVEPAPTPEPEIRQRIVYRCSPDAGAEPDGSADAAETPVDAGPPAVTPSRPSEDDESGRVLPAAPEPTSHAERRQLLSWVKQQSGDLRECGVSDGSTIRTTVTLELNEDGTIRRVLLADTANEISASRRSCLRARMSEWRPPPELVTGRDALIFRLIL